MIVINEMALRGREEAELLMTTTLHSYTDDNAHAVFGTREISSLTNMSEYLLTCLTGDKIR
jgi:hypothetical protein